jgi:rare lipoprotein A
MTAVRRFCVSLCANSLAISWRPAVSRSLQCAAALVLALATACHRDPPPPSKSEAPAAKTIQTGEASFYSHEFAGRKTATGERLKLNAMTAASRALPLGSRVQVVNQETGRSAQVTINDRGPYAKGRILDVTPKVAKHIGMDKDDGVAQVSIKTIPSSASSQTGADQ